MAGMSRAVKRRNLAVVKSVKTKPGTIKPGASPAIIAPRKETPPAPPAPEPPAPAPPPPAVEEPANLDLSLRQIAEELRKLSAAPLTAVSHTQARNIVKAVNKKLHAIRKAEDSVIEFALEAEKLPRRFGVYSTSLDFERDVEWNEMRSDFDDFAKSAADMLDAVASLLADS